MENVDCQVVQARSRLMRHQQEEYQMETRDLKIPRPKVNIFDTRYII